MTDATILNLKLQCVCVYFISYLHTWEFYVCLSPVHSIRNMNLMLEKMNLDVLQTEGSMALLCTMLEIVIMSRCPISMKDNSVAVSLLVKHPSFLPPLWLLANCCKCNRQFFGHFIMKRESSWVLRESSGRFPMQRAWDVSLLSDWAPTGQQTHLNTFHTFLSETTCFLCSSKCYYDVNV